jgi:hypothetical protein
VARLKLLQEVGCFPDIKEQLDALTANAAEPSSNRFTFEDLEIIRTFFGSGNIPTAVISAELCSELIGLAEDVWSRSLFNPASIHYVPDDHVSLAYLARRLTALESIIKELAKSNEFSREVLSAKLSEIIKAQQDMRLAQEAFNTHVMNRLSTVNSATRLVPEAVESVESIPATAGAASLMGPAVGGVTSGVDTATISQEATDASSHAELEYASQYGSWVFQENIGLVWTSSEDYAEV